MGTLEQDIIDEMFAQLGRDLDSTVTARDPVLIVDNTPLTYEGIRAIVDRFPRTRPEPIFGGPLMREPVFDWDEKPGFRISPSVFWGLPGIKSPVMAICGVDYGTEWIPPTPRQMKRWRGRKFVVRA